MVVRVWLGGRLSGFGGSWTVYFFSLVISPKTNSRFEFFVFRFSIRFTFRLLSLSAILAAFSIVRRWFRPFRINPGQVLMPKTQLYAIGTLLCSEHVQVGSSAKQAGAQIVLKAH